MGRGGTLSGGFYEVKEISTVRGYCMTMNVDKISEAMELAFKHGAVPLTNRNKLFDELTLQQFLDSEVRSGLPCPAVSHSALLGRHLAT